MITQCTDETMGIGLLGNTPHDLEGEGDHGDS